MPLKSFPDVKPGGQVSAGELTRLGQATEEQDRVTGTKGLLVRRNAGGFQIISAPGLEFWAKITGNAGSGPTAHSWTEQQETSTGTFIDSPEGRSGTTALYPAYGTDGALTATNTIVRLHLGVGGEFYLFDPPSMGGGAGTLTVREVDLAPTVTMVTTLSFDQADGFIVSNPAAGEAEIDLADASATQRGIVSLADQVMGAGEKYFSGRVAINQSTGAGLGGNVALYVNAGGISLLTSLEIRSVIAAPFTGSLGFNALTSPLEFGLLVFPDTGLFAYRAFFQEYQTSPARYCFVTSTDVPGPVVPFAVFDTGTRFVGVLNQAAMVSVDVRGGIVVGGSSGALPVAQGGTGATTFTTRGILFGNGASALGVTAAGTTGQVLTATTAADPTWQNLAETNSTTKGIVNLSDQFLGAGNKTVETLVVAGGVSISITGAKAQFDGIAYFGSDLWVKHTQSIVVYNAGVTTNRIFFNTTLSEISIDLADGSDLMRLRLDTFLSNALCDLTHNGAGVVPRFGINGVLQHNSGELNSRNWLGI